MDHPIMGRLASSAATRCSGSYKHSRSHIRCPTFMVQQHMRCSFKSTRTFSSNSICWTAVARTSGMQPAITIHPTPLTTNPGRQSMSVLAATSVQCVFDTRSNQRNAPSRLICTATRKRWAPTAFDDHGISTINRLMQLGFTNQQAQIVCAQFDRKKRNLNLQNVIQWLQLLEQCGVDQPCQILSRWPTILSSTAENYTADVTSMFKWMSGLGLDQEERKEVITRQDRILYSSFANVQASDAFLRAELGWGNKEIVCVLKKGASLPFMSAADCLTPSLAWWMSKGFSREALSRLLVTNFSLLNFSVERNERQLTALHDLGLAQTQIEYILRKSPHMVTLNLASSTNQDKLRFLTDVMGQSVQELVVCPEYLKLSLFNTTGPRWCFFALHCPGQSFNLGSRLKRSESEFARVLESASLHAARAATGLSNLELFLEFKQQWQLGEGKEWFRDKNKITPGEDDVSADELLDEQ